MFFNEYTRTLFLKKTKIDDKQKTCGATLCTKMGEKKERTLNIRFSKGLSVKKEKKNESQKNFVKKLF